jgi:haloalkane dehalogenase
VHGNPTSSHLWREVQPFLASSGRTVALDLAGMGKSAKIPEHRGPERYAFAVHAGLFEAFLARLGLDDDVVLVGHDWGAVLCFDWARRHPDAVAGIAYTETMVRPRRWADEGPAGRQMFQRLRTLDGERDVLEDNLFVESVLPAGMLSDLASDDHDIYRAPYLHPGEDRRAMLAWAQQIPFDGEPAETHEILTACSEYLSTSDVPKLLVRADPGAILTGAAATFARSFPVQHHVVVPASHFVPEDAPEQLREALRGWIDEIVGGRRRAGPG